ncbi:kisspeptin 2 [Corythoichthys intestinalis]|uniref:kisspeptin 2 n=1 Tax=Corythoichthys intestinalis TaxID=161448 RepID=UPI0025A4F3DF|nr:kisspeptin 2 [Corythoichthys intestinalis]XP_061809487.1 kisspeptin 2 [Nerophis lumbriciformis]
MKLAVVVLVYGLIVSQDVGCLGASLSGFLPKQETGSVLSRRRAVEDFLEDPELCFSLRENDTQQYLLCNERRNKFNINPFGLRFGKRYNRGYSYSRARTSGFSRQLDVLT